MAGFGQADLDSVEASERGSGVGFQPLIAPREVLFQGNVLALSADPAPFGSNLPVAWLGSRTLDGAGGELSWLLKKPLCRGPCDGPLVLLSDAPRANHKVEPAQARLQRRQGFRQGAICVEGLPLHQAFDRYAEPLEAQFGHVLNGQASRPPRDIFETGELNAGAGDQASLGGL